MDRYCPRCSGPLLSRFAAGKSRPVCADCSFVVFHDPKVAVAVVVGIDRRILLCRRAIEPGRGKWSFPAGYVDRGEIVEEAAKREVREETGLEISLSGLVGVYSHPGNPVILIVFAAASRGSPVASDEALEVGLFAPDALPEMAFEHDSAIVDDWRVGERTWR
jgi:8-oxo-dGTP diphosphatase